ncbi:malate dehydrogenase [Alicyclobacillus fastidiosus]|uniref:Malate dehydrogenase n=1 Tax=Alicyclobacillus fastidiosus TaxID=392011 RepID=A0ABV5ACX9_9BACL|nr:malate dehydrogenase [Alicyclobacillus fastidiosus]WEH11252.1 malate dehydrogenase [Alicyclobacillus fastidiosus]
MHSTKVSIFGAGGTGGEIAELLVERGYEEVSLIDVQRDMAEGKALDIWQSGALVGSDTQVLGGSDAALATGADVVVITAGIGRKPGLNREDLIATNAQVMQQISRSIAAFAPNATVIVLTNPADILARIVFEETGFPAHRVMAQGGILDSARLSHQISRLAGVSHKQVQSMVLGGHGDHMVPIRQLAAVNGVPALHLLSEEAWADAVERTRFGGGEIMEKFKTHGAAVTPAYAVVAMIDALHSPFSQIWPISVRSGGAYGLPEDVFIGLPVRISRAGIEGVLELPIDADEREALQRSAASMQATYETWKHTGARD